MKLACAHAIADSIPYSELTSDYIIPSAFDENVVDLITLKVAEAARQDGVTRS
jgi:malate dehydrogenase (oxaloacetate-decarboxylating)